MIDTLNLSDLINLNANRKEVVSISEKINSSNTSHIHITGTISSFRPLLLTSIFKNFSNTHLIILDDKEEAGYFLNDLENFLNAINKKESIYFFPRAHKTPYNTDELNNDNLLYRTELLSKINNSDENIIIITYPEALTEKVVNKKSLTKNTFKIKTKEKLTIDFIVEFLHEYNFQYSEFVVEPGQYSIRGGIIDIFSFANDFPFRIEFAGDEIDSIRTFNPETQLSIKNFEEISIIPDIHNEAMLESNESIFEFIPENTIIWFKDFFCTKGIIEKKYSEALEIFENNSKNNYISHLSPDKIYLTKEDFISQINKFKTIELSTNTYFKTDTEINFSISPQPVFNKNFELLKQNLLNNTISGFKNLIFFDNQKQLERLSLIFKDLSSIDKSEISYSTIPVSLHEGFIDKNLGVACYTDHQIFERYHRFHLKHAFTKKESLTIKELTSLKPGDYVTHIDHGVGRFAGLEKIEVGGKMQEAVRILYKDNDLLYISIHALHKISKYSGKEGTAPQIHRLGSNTWSNLKNKTKRKVKEIAFDLIKLYAERKTKQGFGFNQDNYMQTELEASFIFEDTPDQIKSTTDVKKDMESSYPMDRLICGDVGFGKTEIAVRAAFKAVCDNKQVGILVPTTILALQHYKTFSERLKNFPCNIDFLSRFKSASEIKKTLEKITAGKTDIIIGTHRLISNDVKFKDIGLLIIDEEHKFGVSAKEKLRALKTNVDTLTLTATPIPRTLQFSLLGARDLSIISTPPPNRYPIKTRIHTFDYDVIKDAINFEISRGGQVFFIHNIVQNIEDIANTIRKLCPHARVGVGHGQMTSQKLEKIVTDFIEGEYDVLVSTTIVESGLDIPNANTIIINNAHNFGLSDLHQMRGRVGRSNVKAFCYLLTQPLAVLSSDAKKRLEALEEFSDLGSGFNIAMRDLDIRGAGDLLGAEQSGFINEMGYDTYLKILKEAVDELKENEFKEHFEEAASEKNYVKDCSFESDLELLIPDDYVSDITERLFLYKELDNIETKEELEIFANNLKDRFGNIPKQTTELLKAMQLRWFAKEIGFEKIILKNAKLTGYFVSNKDSEYYKSVQFSKILNFILKTANCKMKEINNKLILSFENIKEVNSGMDMLKILLNQI
ncbi:MAG: transcription-repair coupling factor [Bacteroidales bacterium]|jgi:transcription-repair coupling factor (superfamily II helicase)